MTTMSNSPEASQATQPKKTLEILKIFFFNQTRSLKKKKKIIASPVNFPTSKKKKKILSCLLLLFCICTHGIPGGRNQDRDSGHTQLSEQGLGVPMVQIANVRAVRLRDIVSETVTIN